jgi:uncharacterized phage infection (PIP) family protein YhgE
VEVTDRSTSIRGLNNAWERATSIKGMDASAENIQHLPPLPKKELTIEMIQEALEKFSSKVVDTERQLRAEMDSKLSEELKKREADIEETHHQERLRYEKDIQEMKSLINTQLENERLAFVEEKQALEELLVRANCNKTPPLLKKLIFEIILEKNTRQPKTICIRCFGG